MSFALNIFLNVLLLAALLGFVVAMGWLTFWSTDVPLERVMRAFAFFGGALVVLAANAAGVSFAQYTVNALSGVRPAGGGAKFLATVLPGGAGVAFGWYLIRAWRKHEVIGLRIMAFIGMLAATSFALVYAQAFNVKGVHLGAAILPNAAFVVGLIIYTMIKFVPAGSSTHSSFTAHTAQSIRDRLLDRRVRADHAPSTDPPVGGR